MTANNFRKWVLWARILRHITDACFIATLLVTELASIEILLNTTLTKSPVSYMATIIGEVFIIAGGFLIFYCGSSAIFGRRNFIFGQKRSRELAYELTGSRRLPSDAVKNRSKVAKLIVILVGVSVAICVFVQFIMGTIAPEIASAITTIILYTSFVSIAITALACVALAIYLKIAKAQLESLLDL